MNRDSSFGPLAKRQFHMVETGGFSALPFLSIASWCNGSTRDSGSLCLGSNPSEAANEEFSNFDWRIFDLGQMQGPPDGDRELAVYALEMILLDAGDRVGNEFRVHAVDRATIVAAVSHHRLECGDVGRIAQQLVPRLEVIIEART